jgi:hypothetical protein
MARGPPLNAPHADLMWFRGLFLGSFPPISALRSTQKSMLFKASFAYDRYIYFFIFEYALRF